MITIRNKEGLIKALCEYKEFTYGGHIEASIIKNVYRIVDYDTTILIMGLDGVVEFFNNKFYSNTTSRLQNILKEVFNINAPERKTYLFDTKPKKAFCTDAGLAGKVFFNNDGKLTFFVNMIKGENIEFISPNFLMPIISLKLADTWCDIETRLLLKQEVSQ